MIVVVVVVVVVCVNHGWYESGICLGRVFPDLLFSCSILRVLGAGMGGFGRVVKLWVIVVVIVVGVVVVVGGVCDVELCVVLREISAKSLELPGCTFAVR